MSLSFEKLHLPLKYTWAISRNASSEKTNFIVHWKADGFEGKGEVAPNIRYGEDLETVENQLNYVQFLANSLGDWSSFSIWLDSLSIFPSVRFGVESAFIHWLVQKENKTIYDFLDVKKPEIVPTAYTIPILPVDEIPLFFNQWDLGRFRWLKVKINQTTAKETLETILPLSHQKIIIDANEDFKEVDVLVEWLKTLPKDRIEMVEQPFPADKISEYRQLKKLTPFPIFADESVTTHADWNVLKEQFHGINIKLMKTGSWVKAVQLLTEAKKQGFQTMIGCMVETTLAIQCGWAISSLVDLVDLDSFMVLKQEPFQILQEKEGFLREKR